MAEVLKSHIAERIQREGPISFHHFMEMALYYPSLGFYTSGLKRTGREGDFLTSAAMSPVFGTLVARQIAEMKRHCDAPFTVIEYGGGNGELCREILRHFAAAGEPEKVRYVMIEKNPHTRATLADFSDQVQFVDTLSEIGSFNGCVVCNELLDNLPVHRVVMEDTLKEVYVDYADGKFNEVLCDAGSDIKQHLLDLRVELPRGFRTEVNMAAKPWLADIAGSMETGFVLILDYGHLAGDFFHSDRKNGTLACFLNHQVHHNPYVSVGEQDITAHVNFSSVALFAQQTGFGLTGFTTQEKFLKALGFFEAVKQQNAGNMVRATQREDFLTRFLIEDMGKKVKVMALNKGLSAVRLSGFKAS